MDWIIGHLLWRHSLEKVTLDPFVVEIFGVPVIQGSESLADDHCMANSAADLSQRRVGRTCLERNRVDRNTGIADGWAEPSP